MDNSGKEKEAIQLMAEADKKVKSSGSFLGGMFGWGYRWVLFIWKMLPDLHNQTTKQSYCITLIWRLIDKVLEA